MNIEWNHNEDSQYGHGILKIAEAAVRATKGRQKVTLTVTVNGTWVSAYCDYDPEACSSGWVYEPYRLKLRLADLRKVSHDRMTDHLGTTAGPVIMNIAQRHGWHTDEYKKAIKREYNRTLQADAKSCMVILGYACPALTSR